MCNWKRVALAAEVEIFFCDRTSPGSAARTRTNVLPRQYLAKDSATYQCTARPISAGWPPNSTTGPANASASRKSDEIIGYLLQQ
jgi:hypothetical protein